MSKILQQPDFPICTLRQRRTVERLHDLLQCNWLLGYLIESRADEAKRPHTNGLRVHISRSVFELRTQDLRTDKLSHVDRAERSGIVTSVTMEIRSE